MRSLVALSVLTLSATFFAGCLDQPVGLDEAASEAPSIAIDESLMIEAKNCRQGGGNSVYKMQEGQTRVGPFLAADQRPEVGDPMIGAYTGPTAPMEGPTNGIWHVGTVCESYTYKGKEYKDFKMGWIAQLIERPDFDTWANPRIQFFVADLSFNEQAFVDATKESTGGAEISPASVVTIEWQVPEKYLHVVITEANHGTFDFTGEIHKEFGKKETEHIRFWMLPRTDGMGHAHCETDTCMMADEAPPMYRPISIDVFDTATGGGRKLAGESIGTFFHFDTAGNHYGNPLAHYQDGFDRTIIIGPAPEGVTYDRTWLH